MAAVPEQVPAAAERTSTAPVTAAADKLSSSSSSFWPGKPAYDLSADTHLVRIGKHSGPVENARDYVIEHLDEFIEVYKNRPDKTNTCGIRINHALAIYTVVKRLQPTTIIESGVNSGQSTYFFRATAGPSTKIISLDPLIAPSCGQPIRWIDTTNNEYLTGDNFTDFNEVNWKARIQAKEIDPATTLIFIDDHRGSFLRVPTMARVGFRHIMNGDNYREGQGATPQDKAGWTPKQMFRKPNDANTAWLFANLKTYAEFPPLVPPVS